jgi:uncharacterized membrane protein
MEIDNTALMTKAREALKGKWGIATGGSFIYILITMVVGAPKDIGNILSLLIDGPMLLGLAVFSLALARKQEVQISQLFVGFNEYVRTLSAYLLMMIFILLWALLFIIPGIIMALAYSQTFFILAEDKTISPRDAMRKSQAMMEGHKEGFFVLGLRFFGWVLLSVLTFGIGFIWLLPYIQVTMALFYEEVSRKFNSQIAKS